jgi:outer membrane protein assembly factor BamB
VVIGEDKVLISSGYGVGCELIQVSVGADGSLETSTIWKNRNLKAKFSNTVIYEEDAYGLDDGILVCIDLQTGKRRWKGGRYGHGQLILADRHLVVLTERGELVIVKPDQERLLETAKIKMISGKTWNHPALAAPFLLVRNATEAACYKFTAMER